MVLIETSWNVKEAYEHEYLGVPSINRNIVECKGGLQRLRILRTLSVLIETSWNVKLD